MEAQLEVADAGGSCIPAGILHLPPGMRRIVLTGLLALGVAGCQPTDRDMTPVPDPAGSGAPLYDEGLEPGETRDDLGG